MSEAGSLWPGFFDSVDIFDGTRQAFSIFMFFVMLPFLKVSRVKIGFGIG